MKKSKEVSDLRWWLKEEPHSHVFQILERISDQTQLQRQADLYHACLYDDAALIGLGPQVYSATEYEPAQLAFNVVRQAVDTLTAKIAKNQPLPAPITSGGTFRQKRRAQKFGKAIEGQFDISGVWRTSPTIARDCALFGTGLSYNYRVGETIYHERVLPWEVRVNPREAFYGKPRNIYLRRWVDRYVLAERYPEFAEEIEDAESPTAEEFDLGYDDTCDLVLVAEAWHLPSKPVIDDEEHDGWHSICISNKTLLKRPYKHQYFPFAALRMSDPIFGFFGTGLAKQLTGLQYTINDTAAVVQEAHALSGGYILVEAGSNVDTDKLQNGRGLILRYNGTPPQWISPEPAHPDTWRFARDLIPMAFEMSGVSQLSAQSQKPPGVESAIAMNTFNDFETERFALFAKQYEEYHIDVAWQLFDLMEEIQKDGGKLKIRTTSRDRGARVLKEYEYDKIRLDRSDFVLQVWPTSLLSKKPSARIQEIEQFINLGWLTPEDGRELLDFPDLDRHNSLAGAASRIVDDILDKMLDADDPNKPGVYTYPEPEFNLKLCIAKGIQAYLDARADGAPDENLQLVQQFIEDARELLNPTPEEPAAPTPGMPLADPAAAEMAAMGGPLPPEMAALPPQPAAPAAAPPMPMSPPEAVAPPPV